MFYPKKFKERVKKVYPNWEELHRALDRGDPLVGDYLYSHFCFGIPCNVILAATSLEALQSKVREHTFFNVCPCLLYSHNIITVIGINYLTCNTIGHIA